MLVEVVVDDNYLVRADDGDCFHLVAYFEMRFFRLDSSFQTFSFKDFQIDHSLADVDAYFDWPRAQLYQH